LSCAIKLFEWQSKVIEDETFAPLPFASSFPQSFPPAPLPPLLLINTQSDKLTCAVKLHQAQRAGDATIALGAGLLYNK
jgi:hypothetical protein